MGFLIDMIDVAEGDSFLLTIDKADGSEFRMLIDGGPPQQGETVSNFLIKEVGGVVNVVIGTHSDIDHIGGLGKVIDRCKIGSVFLNLPKDIKSTYAKLTYQRKQLLKKASAEWDFVEKSLEALANLAEALKKKNFEPRPLTAGMYWNFGDVVINILSPNEDRLATLWNEIESDESSQSLALREIQKQIGIKVAPETSAENNSSIILEVLYKGEPYALFAADAGADVLKEVTKGKNYRFLKVPHHGSKTGLDELLIAQLKPQQSYIPVGENPHGHPAIEVLEMLRKYGSKTFCSQKTKDCRRDCPPGGFGNLCHRKDKNFRSGWSIVEPTKCSNNK